MNSKTKKIITWTLTLLVSFVFVASGAMKLFSPPAEMLQGLGGASNVTILGILELSIIALTFIPRTSVLGTLLLIAYVGGAMAVHVTTGQAVLPLIIIQSLVFITAALRFPELTQRLMNKTV